MKSLIDIIGTIFFIMLMLAVISLKMTCHFSKHDPFVIVRDKNLVQDTTRLSLAVKDSLEVKVYFDMLMKKDTMRVEDWYDASNLFLLKDCHSCGVIKIDK